MSEPEVDEISNRTFYYASGTELQICNRKRIEENFTWNHADGIADTDFKENNNSPFVPYWVRINNKFYSNFIDIPSLELNSVFSKEISKSLAYLAQLGEFERLMVYFAIEHHYEVIEGPININLFMRLLKSGELQFNVTYIIELQ
ncbi:hypothetical protein [Exiguobacterium chiriqhucha]|uniref:hypothetical protein n=1 Tax=Exiguobacterium chiriqhucha TaxID=1385984 RepID=UPI000494DE94|nr:hypothetical protein [Exiguobacterium chiriqhucha]